MASSTPPNSVKTLLLSTTILTAAIAIKLCFLPALRFAVNYTPAIWSVILSCLEPPYVYFIINGIIITIAASSHYQNNNQSQPLINDDTDSESSMMSIQRRFDVVEQPVNDLDVVRSECEDKFVISRSVKNSSEEVRTDFSFPVKEKPLVSSRFAHQRKSGRFNPEGVRSLRVAKPRKHETLESTWKTITAGRHMPLNRHIRKQDIFENHYNHTPSLDVCSYEQGPTSVETDYNRNHRILSSIKSLTSSSKKLRKEASLSCDELNRRVEAFIKKVNEEMRLERQESLKRYFDMINRGAT